MKTSSRKQRLSIYKKMITLLEGNDFIYIHGRSIANIKEYGYCWLLDYIIHIRHYKTSFTIYDLTELMKYEPSIGWIKNENFWFPHMCIEGVERRLNILKEIVKQMEDK